MTSKYINIFIRIVGLAITALFVIQPWILDIGGSNPFLFSGWLQIVAASISLSFSALFLIIYRPVRVFNTLTHILFIIFLAIVISLSFTHYNSSLRISLIYIGLLASLGALRLFRRQEDNFGVAGMIAISGFFMAVYAFCQNYGCDFLVWESKYTVVGTLTNPNFLGIFLCLTAIVTLGLAFELRPISLKNSLIFLSFFIIQLGALLIIKKSGINLCISFMVLLWIWADSFKSSGKLTKISPIIFGFFIALFLLFTQWVIFDEISKYPWEKLTKVPNNYKPFVARLIQWQMGFSIFKEHPKTGTGAGSIPYIMPLKRPPTGSILGLAIYNDDPHSFIITTLSETGFIGLWGISSLFVYLFGCFIRKNTRYEKIKISSLKEKEEQVIEFPWLYTFIALLILYLSIESGFVHIINLPIAISFIVIFFGISTSIINMSYTSNSNSDYFYLGKSTFVGILTFVFYGLFNNNFTILPLIGMMVLIISLHLSCCLPELRYKPKFTIISIFFIFLPIIYFLTATHFQLSYQLEEKYIGKGIESFGKQKYKDSEQYFLSAIETNSQSLRAYSGLAHALEFQGKTDEALDVLNQLDTMVPNIFNVKYNIAKILFEHNKIHEAHVYAVKNLEWADDPLSYELLGQILLLEQNKKEAEQVFKEGLISIPSSSKERMAADRMRLNLAWLAYDRGDYKISKTYLNLIESDLKDTIDAMYLKGIFFCYEKNYKEALDIFEKALRIYPDVPRILNAIGFILTETNKDLPRAQLLLERAFELLKRNERLNNLSDYLMVTNSLGMLYQKQKKYKQAGELLKIAYEETPEEYKELKARRLKDLNNFYNSFGKDAN